MIWETLIDNLIYVSATKLKIGFNNLMKLDDLIIENFLQFKNNANEKFLLNLSFKVR